MNASSSTRTTGPDFSVDADAFADRQAVSDRARRLLAQMRAGVTPEGALDFRGVSLIGEDFSGLALDRADFEGAELSRANFSDASLFGASLKGAILFEANLSRAELSGADLTDANLVKAQLERAGLGMAQLERANLAMARLDEACLIEANLREANLSQACLLGARARSADLTNANATKAEMRNVELEQAVVGGCSFDGANFQGANLKALIDYRRASWIGVDIRDIDFTGAYLCRGFIMDQNFLEEFRTQSRWSGWVYEAWRLTSNCGQSISRWTFCTLVLVFFFAWLFTLVGVDYGDYPTSISPLYYSVVTLTTLGYGDILPSTVGGQVVAMCEVVTGYVMMGGLLSIFSNRMASRAS